MGIVADGQRSRDGMQITNHATVFVTHINNASIVIASFEGFKTTYSDIEDITEINLKLTQAQTLVNNLLTQITDAIGS